MATIISVHGTFAHTGGSAEALNIAETTEAQWWQNNSAFENHLRELVRGDDGTLNFVPFSWSALNSELSRRQAGSALLKEIRKHEAAGEKYCVIGHSHGGSVIGSALMESVARGQPLKGLSKWITIGTPFVELKREKFLFSRLNLTRQVMFVASLMLLMMFLFYMFGELFDNIRRITSERLLMVFLFSGAMMSVPFILLYTFFKIEDGRELFSYGRKTLRKAQEHYSKKWLSFCHEDDEAVQGLRYLPNVKLHFFEKDFATSTLTTAAIFVLPLAYLFVVTSPTVMIGIADFLKDRVYGVDQYQGVESPVSAAQQEIRKVAQEMRRARDEAGQGGLDAARSEDARQRAEALRAKLRTMRQNLETSYPEINEIQRALRFKRRFLEENGKPCPGGSLCGEGRSFTLNSKLLYHVVTDELSNALVDDDTAPGMLGGVLRLAIPIVLVPVVFGVIALAVLGVIRFVASHLSDYLSRWLNALTLKEIRRSAYGNDTDGEIAFAADHRPSWITPAYCCLPAELGDKISEQSNHATFQSLAKFRNAISTLAFSEGESEKSNLISSYLSWKELIHTSYFEVPEFRKLVARAIADSEGFSPTERFRADPDYERVSRWLAEIPPKPPEAMPAATLPGTTPVRTQTPVPFPA
jgi:hypothetical protein